MSSKIASLDDHRKKQEELDLDPFDLKVVRWMNWMTYTMESLKKMDEELNRKVDLMASEMLTSEEVVFRMNAKLNRLCEVRQ